jgi:hypothetical protein
MLLTLPIELQSIIYDKCYIEDRDNLNKILPKNLRHKNKNDKKLHLIAYAMKRKKNKEFPSESIYRFIQTNSDDPTVKRYCEDIGLNVQTITLSPLDILLEDIRNKNLKNIDKYPKCETLDSNELYAFETTVYRCANGNIFNKLYNDPNTKEMMKRTILYRDRDTIFNIVNHGNEPLLRYFCKEGEKYGITKTNFNEVFTSLRNFSSRKDCRRLLLKYFDISQEHKNEMLGYVVDVLDVEGFTDMIEAGATF